MMTAIEIIDETVKYYRTHDRGLDATGGCVYRNYKGCMCAVGRAMTGEGLKQYGTFQGDFSNLITEVHTDYSLPIDSILKDEYKGHDELFWEKLQKLHDGISYWKRFPKRTTGYKLTEEGEKRVVKLKKMFKDG